MAMNFSPDMELWDDPGMDGDAMRLESVTEVVFHGASDITLRPAAADQSDVMILSWGLDGVATLDLG